MAHDLALSGPILLPAFAAILLLLVDLLPGPRRTDGSLFLGALGALVSLLYSVFYLAGNKTGLAFSGTLDVDRMALIASAIVSFAALLAILLSRQYLLHRPDIEETEYHAFILTSASGMCLLAAANDLVCVFLGIELLSIPLYLLAASRRDLARPIEAGFKYLLLGAFASAFLLYGAALLYASSGTTLLSAIPSEMRRLDTAGGPVAALGTGMLLGGILFKLGAAPFHMWSPDVYEGSPTPVTAFMATATKAAALVALLRAAPIIATGIGPERGATILGAIAVLSMVVGNVGALRQTNLKRLLAYSSIAHAGYMLTGLAAVVALDGRSTGADGGAAILYYLAAYAAMNLGAFAVAVVLDRGQGRENLEELSGLSKSRPALAVAMSVFALALAGIPPTAGFLGKLYLFQAVVDAGLIPLAVLGVLASVVGLYYYLRLLILMYVRPLPSEREAAPAGDQWLALASLVTLAITLGLGLLPGRFIEFIQSSLRAGN